MIRAFRVFNAAQVEGWEPPVIANQGEAEHIENAEIFVANTGARISHGSHGAFYVPKDDRISMPSMDAFTGTATSSATEAYYGTLLHECAIGPAISPVWIGICRADSAARSMPAKSWWPR